MRIQGEKMKSALDMLMQNLNQIGAEVTSCNYNDFTCDFTLKHRQLSTKDFPNLEQGLPDYSVILSISGLAEGGQRIHMKHFATEAEKTHFLQQLKDIEGVDHRVIGPNLGYFRIDQDVALGMIIWLQKGTYLIEKIKSFLRKIMMDNGYIEVATPALANLDLWRQSGHWDMYRQNMCCVQAGEKEDAYALKPMNCPLHVSIFKSLQISYKNLPYKISEFGQVTRYEPSGSLHGLFRARCFTQDDAHVFCTEDQITSVIENFIRMLRKVYRAFNFDNIELVLATRPEVFIGAEEAWDKAESDLKTAANRCELDPIISAGDGAFYGPKLEFRVKDKRGRVWTCGTVQLDFELPKRLGARYINSGGNEEVPVMIHHAILGSIERFVGILLENTEGKMPFWLSPTQVAIIPVHPKYTEYAKTISKLIQSHNISNKIDETNETLNFKVRKWWDEEYVPVTCILGEKEMENQTVSLRINGIKVENMLTLDEFVEKLKDMGTLVE